MPIAPRFTWKQNNDAVEVTAEIRGINTKLFKDFVQITPIYLSLNFSPYLFQIDFCHEIDTFNIKVVILNNKEIKFIFPKKIKNKKWIDLNSKNDKKIILQRRKESIDKLYEKQKQLREKREKIKKLRFKAAQQRQWDEQKYLKHVIDKLETEQKHISESNVKHWIDDKKTDDIQTNITIQDIDDENELKEPQIRKSSVVEIGFSAWNYFTPARDNSKPPDFARKTKININKNNNKIDNISKISDITPIFLCDKGIKYFLNEDYKSGINSFDEAIKLDNEYLEAYCNQFQCYIHIQMTNPIKFDLNYDLITEKIEKMEEILKTYNVKSNKIVVNVIVMLQKSIIQTFILLNNEFHLQKPQKQLKQSLTSIESIIKNALKTYEFQRKMNNLNKIEFGIFKDIKNMENLYRISNLYLKIIEIFKIKISADNLLKSENYFDSIDKYSNSILNITNFTDNNQSDNYFLIFIKNQCLNNRSLAYFSSKQFIDCVEDCNKIIENNKYNNYGDCRDYKPFIRRGASYLSLWKLDKQNKIYLENCLNDYQTVSQYDTNYETHAHKIKQLLSSLNI